MGHFCIKYESFLFLEEKRWKELNENRAKRKKIPQNTNKNNENKNY